jgi:hypothetical protein
MGGPNLSPPGDGHIADCVANAPGGPVHVLLTDTVAEHIPGCNMAFRRECLVTIGGFDPRFRVAGDDVDVCWRLQEHGWTLGFSPAALVWHHRRNSIARYLKQQRGYAKAEALLAEKWPGKYNSFGHPTWGGRLYGNGNIKPLLQRPRIYHGTWGSALFQSIYEPAAGHFLLCLSLMPEWYALLLALGLGSALGLIWSPLLAVAPILFVCLALTIAQAAQGARRANFDSAFKNYACRLCLRGLVASLHLLQPAARLVGRVQHGLGPWNCRKVRGNLPRPQLASVWCEEWAASEDRLASIESLLQKSGADVARGGDFDDWDLMVKGGLFGSVRVRTMTEEHGAGKQMFRLRAWPHLPKLMVLTTALLALTSFMAVLDQAWPAGVAVAIGSTAIASLTYRDCALAMRSWSEALTAYSHDIS